MISFKSYSEKSKARRALIQIHKREDADDFLVQKKGKWGFNLEDGYPVMEDVFAASQVEPELEPEPEPEPDTGVHKTIGAPASDEPEEVAAPSPFGSFAFAQLTNGNSYKPPVEPRAVRAVSTKGHKIEKNRPVQNGVKIPSSGTLCRAVWDELTTMSAVPEAATPTAAEIKAVGVLRGWNNNNVSIEYYRWKKFNGIGRGK